jgi:hypothetical protein
MPVSQSAIQYQSAKVMPTTAMRNQNVGGTVYVVKQTRDGTALPLGLSCDQCDRPVCWDDQMRHASGTCATTSVVKDIDDVFVRR